jgi:hypothetical protein
MMPSYPSGPGRYRIGELSDGRLLAFDTAAPTALLLTPRPANGTYRLERGGTLTVRNGTLTDVQEPATTAGYRIAKAAFGQFRVSCPGDPAWQLVVDGAGKGAPGASAYRFAILGLQDGNLLRIRAGDVSELRVTPAPDGSYRTAGGQSIGVQGGGPTPPLPPPKPGGDPMLEFAETFAP